MNTAIIESLTWHKDQLFKLLNSDQDLEKYEGSIYNLEKDLDEIIEKAERGIRREKVPVRRKSGTRYEYRRVGRKEELKSASGQKKEYQKTKEMLQNIEGRIRSAEKLPLERQNSEYSNIQDTIDKLFPKIHKNITDKNKREEMIGYLLTLSETIDKKFGLI